MSGLFRKVIDQVYLVCYRILYYPYAWWVIRHSRLTVPPLEAVACDYFHEEDLHFLLIHIPVENRWLFWKRHFAFSRGNDRWYTMPSLIPWESVANGYRKYRLNSYFVDVYMDDPDDDWQVQFLTWK